MLFRHADAICNQFDGCPLLAHSGRAGRATAAAALGGNADIALLLSSRSVGPDRCSKRTGVEGVNPHGVTQPSQTSHGIAPPTMMPVAACMRYAQTTIFAMVPKRNTIRH
jgi:hypothetical protein